jgi:hypothetical protein
LNLPVVLFLFGGRLHLILTCEGLAGGTELTRTTSRAQVEAIHNAGYLFFSDVAQVVHSRAYGTHCPSLRRTAKGVIEETLLMTLGSLNRTCLEWAGARARHASKTRL